MKRQVINIYIYGILCGLIFIQTSCTKDYNNPAAVPVNQAFSSPQAMTGVAVGLQRLYTVGRASSLYNRISMDGLLTNQLVVLNQGNTSEYQLQLGAGAVDGTNTMLGGLWTTSNKIIFDADNVINNAKKLGDKNYASGLIGYTSIFKALAIGDLAMFWEKVPASIGANVSFSNRTDGFNTALAVINDALAAIQANPISVRFSNTLPSNPPPPALNPAIDILATLQALKARYSLFIGNYAQALAAANAVDLVKKSTLTFNTVNLNPIYETATSTNNVYAPSNLNMGLPAGLQPDAGDKRILFYITTDTVAPLYRVRGFGAGSATPWPIYLPGEMMLIKAEAYARQASPDLANALVELNKVVTKKPIDDPYGVGADLPMITGSPSQTEILDLIYKHRGIELYMSGLRMEDMRRFGRPNTEKKRNFLPYPFLERDNNSNTPPDPGF